MSWDWGDASEASEVTVGRKSLRASGMPDQDRGRHWPAAGLSQQDGTMDFDQGGDLAFELVEATSELADATHELGGDAHARGPFERSQPPRDAFQRARTINVAGGDAGLKFGQHVEQMPAQAVDDPGALGDEVLAVVTQQPDLERSLV